MQIRSENDLKLAYETINSFKEMLPMAQKTDAALEYIKELKRDIRGFYRYLTELECWRLQGYTDEDFERAKKAQQKKGRYYTALYKQAGNSIAVPIFESIFRKIILNEVREKEEQR